MVLSATPCSAPGVLDDSELRASSGAETARQPIMKAVIRIRRDMERRCARMATYGVNVTTGS